MSAARHDRIDRLLRVGVPPLPAAAGGVAVVAVIAGAYGTVADRFGTAPMSLALVIPVIGVSVIGGRRAAAVVVAAATVAFGYLVPPYGSIRVELGKDALALAVFLLVAAVTTTIVSRRIQLLDDLERQRRALLRSVSHDLRTPLGVIHAAATELGGDVEYDAEARRRLLDHVVAETERLDRLVSNLLDLSRVESGTLVARPEPVDVGRLVRTSWELLTARLPSARLDLRVDDNARQVAADPTLLDQLVTNLLENALRHGAGGSVDVSVVREPRAVVLTVHNDGPGIDPSLRDHLFEPFQAAGTTAGRGVGLAICRAIAEAHGGTLDLADPDGGGTTFRLRLPE